MIAAKPLIYLVNGETAACIGYFLIPEISNSF